MNWERVKLGDIATYINGYSFKPTDWSYKGLPIIRIQNLTNPEAEYNCFEGYYKSKYEINNNDILISWSATLGVFKWNRGKALLNQHIFKVIFDKKNVNKDFFVYMVNQELNNLMRNTHGSTMKHITKKRFENHLILLPPLETQKKIVNILDKAQALINKRKEQIELMDKLVQSLFYDMFGDPVVNPKNWEIQFLSFVAEIKSGVTKGRKLNNQKTVSVPYMRVANVQDGYLDLNDISNIEVLPSDIEKYGLKKNDLLLTEGGDPDKLGRGAIWKNEIKNCIHQNHIFRIRLNSNVLNAQFASNLIGSTRGKRYFLKSAKQTTGIASINMTQLKKFPFLIPPLELQNQFAEKVEKIEHQKKLMQKSLKELEDNFNSLMQKAFKGEI
ncbi:MAG: restriction endonuclease subunit S [Candidatus Muiribacteriota bacterium]